MKKVIPILILNATLTSVSAFPVYDPFADATASGGTSYTAGADLWKQTNAAGDIWFGCDTGNAGGHVVLTNVSLSYPGLPVSPGNCVRFRNVNGGPGARMFVSLDSNKFFFTTNQATLYYSLLLQVPDVSTLTTAGGYDIGFNNAATVVDQTGQPGIQGAGLYLKKNGAGYQVGIDKNPANINTPVYDPVVRSTNDTLFVVAAYEINTNSTTDDNVRLWVNPAASTFGTQTPPVETTNVLAAGADVNNFISSLCLLNRSTAIPNGFLVDDVRMGKTWAFVTGGPEIGVPPADTNVPYGGSFTLTASARSGGPSGLTYQWQRNGTNLANGGNVSGATTTNLTVTTAGGADAGTYSIIVSNAMGAATNFAVVTILDPVVTTQPTNQLFAPGATAHFSIVAAGTPILRYQWQRDGTNLVNGGNIAGSTTAALTVSSVSDADVAAYSCLVTNGLGNSTVSSNATLALVDPGFVLQPHDVTTNYGATVVLSAAAVGTPPLSYLWQKDGVNLTNGPSASGATITGATSTNLTIAGVTYLDTGAYTLLVTNGLGSSLASDPAFLSVNDPYIIAQPVGHTNVQGTTVSFTVSANGTPPVSHAWYKDINPLSDGGNISGAASNTLTITSAGLPDIGNYYVIVTSGSGSNVVSTTAPLKITLPLGQVLYWDSNGTAPGAGDPPTGTWGTDNFWSTDASGTTSPGGWNDGSTAVFSAGTDAVSPVTVTVNSTRAVTGITFEDGAVTLNSGTISMIGGNGQSTIAVADTLLATINTTVVSGTNDLVKTGNGTLRLNANNTFTGRTIIRGGTESVQGDSRFGAIPLSFQADNIILDGGTLECNATSNPGQQNNGQRGILITTNNGTIAESAANGTGALTVFGVISGPGKLTKTGGAVLRLENNNTFAGGTDLNDGKIYANTSGALGTGVIRINTNSATAIMLRTTLATTGVTITLTNDIVLTPGANPVLAPGGTGAGANLAVTGVISGDGGLTRNSTGDKDLILSGNNTFTGGFTITDYYVVIGNKSAFGTGLLTLGDPAITPAHTMYLDPQFDLTGVNAITNPVVVNQQFSLALHLSHNIELSGPIELANPNIPIYANLTNGVHVFSGTVSSTNGYGFTKQGAGTLVLSGDNTYAGGTTVAGGTLAVNNSTGSGTGPGAVTVNAGTLVGSGTIGGPVSVGSDGVSWGTVSGGRGLATVGKLTLTNGLDMSTLGVTNAWELGALKDDSNGVAGTDFDQLAVTGGTVNVGGATLVLGFVGGASAPDPANPFWQANHTWTVVRLSGGASNPGSTNFAAIGNGSYAAGNFTTAVAGDGSIRLVFTAAPTVSIKTISATTTSATISWNTLSGLNYQVLYNTNVSTTNWLLLTNVTGNGGLITITDNHGGAPQRYYRLFAY